MLRKFSASVPFLHNLIQICAWKHLTSEGEEASQNFIKNVLHSLSTGMIKFNQVLTLDSWNILASLLKNFVNVLDEAAVLETTVQFQQKL